MHHFFHRMRRLAEGAEEARCMGRHRMGRGFGPFAYGFGEHGLGGHGFRMGRKLGSSDLQVVLLALLSDRPSHGYELIKAIEERSGGFYAPSPGVIYPALTYLEEVGYANVVSDGAKKQYSITDEGRAFLKDNRESADAILSQLEHFGARMGRVRDIFSGFDDEYSEAKEILAARRDVKMALREKRHVTAAERRRIVEILKRAAADIRGGGDER